ncbi:MAG TPA: CopG family transcriptional regulator [Candidatus Bathyarchaeota archaeon]|nr:CopG family transcriptional regulator [Candidatus Bathyarchaeota archaeon]
MRRRVERYVRFSVSTPEELLKKFDETISGLGLERSKAIRMAMERFLTENSLKVDRKIFGNINIVYNHEVREVDSRLTDIQHHYLDIIVSTLHFHISKETCMLVITVRGENERIKSLLSSISSIRGVEDVKSCFFTEV